MTDNWALRDSKYMVKKVSLCPICEFLFLIIFYLFFLSFLFNKLIGQAEKWALQKSGVQIILCTCVALGKPKLTRSCDNIQQCIVDECGMCMELESLVPITCSKARQVVLIGDHKQLQPIIQDNLAMKFGLSVSMFERLSERATMLELQYRMVREYRTVQDRLLERQNLYYFTAGTDKSCTLNLSFRIHNMKNYLFVFLATRNLQISIKVLL